jgi:molecular chaperone GrpE
MADKPVSEPVDVPPDASDPLDDGAATESVEAPAAPDPVAELKRERDEFHDRWLRKTAEFDNYRKRIERERREQTDQALVGLLLDLLAVVDDFDLALTVEAGPEAEGYRKGVELIHAKLHDFLKKRGVTPIEAIGADFDPNVHQAVMHEVSPDHREGEVIGELRKGYMLGDRLLRPAMVRVAKA